MRKFLLLVVLALIFSIAIYLGVGSDSYFLLRIGDWAMQMTLFVAFLLAVLLVVVVRISWGLFRGVFLGAWPAAWRNRRQQNLTREALENLAIANWAGARKDLVRLANQTEKPVPLVVLSAQASEAMADYQEAKTVYKKALDEFPDWSNIIQLRLCDIALSEGELDQAQAYIDELESVRFDNPELYVLKARLAEEHRDWVLLKTILEQARKKKLLYAKVAPIERRFLYTRLAGRPGARDILEVKDYVSSMDKVPVDIVSQLVRLLAIRGHNKDAEVLARKVLNKDWSDSLMAVYTELEAESPKQQLKVAEGWLASHSHSEVLIEGLQKLAVRAGQEDKADAYSAKLDALTAEPLALDNSEK